MIELLHKGLVTCINPTALHMGLFNHLNMCSMAWMFAPNRATPRAELIVMDGSADGFKDPNKKAIVGDYNRVLQKIRASNCFINKHFNSRHRRYARKGRVQKVLELQRIKGQQVLCPRTDQWSQTSRCFS